jgi:hypothetical protein
MEPLDWRFGNADCGIEASCSKTGRRAQVESLRGMRSLEHFQLEFLICGLLFSIRNPKSQITIIPVLQYSEDATLTR